jgi:hypothetical protein
MVRIANDLIAPANIRCYLTKRERGKMVTAYLCHISGFMRQVTT